MDRKEILEKLTPLVRTVFESPELVLTDEMSSETMDKWTSLSFMQLLTAIEQEFGFRFKMMELLSLKNMGDIISTIEKHG